MTSFIEPPSGLVEASDAFCSNFDHVIDEKVVRVLETGDAWAPYPGWNFWASVWFDKATGEFVAAVRRYHALVANYRATTPRALKEQICEGFGDE